MPFSNPVVGGTALVRPAINSPNYVAGVSGWSINKDGSSEFSNTTVRGTIIDGTPGGARIEIGPKPPPSPPGPADEIRIYNNSGVQVIGVDPNGITAGNDLTNFLTANYIRLNVLDATMSNPGLEIQPGQTFSPTQNWSAGLIQTNETTVGVSAQQALAIYAPIKQGGNYATDAALLVVEGRSVDGTLGARIVAACDVFHVDSISGTLYAAVIPNPSSSTANLQLFHTNASNGGNRAVSVGKNGDANPGWFVDFDGHMQWGPGGASGTDTNLSRSSAGVLSVSSDLKINGTSAFRGALPFMASANNSLTLTATDQTVPGTSFIYSLNPNSTFHVVAFFDVVCSTVSAGNVSIGRLYVDGVVQAGEAHGPMDILNRGTYGMTWSGTISSAGSHTIELRASKAGAGGVASLFAIHTRYTIVFYEST